jgi:hypothetical protein
MSEENLKESTIRIYSGTLRSGLLIRGEEHAYKFEVAEGEDKQTFSKIHFDKPVKVEDDLARTWDGVATAPLWDYCVKLEFNQNLGIKTDAELKILGRKKLDSIASRMSFIASVPIFILPGSYLLPVEDETKKVIDGVTYYKTVFTATHRGQFNPPRVLNQAATENYTEFFYIDKLRTDGAERIERSLRWLLHSYKAPSVVDEFLSLMISFEAISNLLGDSASESYWECSSCGKSFQNCPNCQNSTARPKPGDKKMRDFVVEELGWSKKNGIPYGICEVEFLTEIKIFYWVKKLLLKIISRN